MFTICEANKRVALAVENKEEMVRRALVGAQMSNAEHVFTRLYPDQSLAAAMKADVAHAAGRVLHPLAGLPVTVKDLFDVAGEPTLSGSIVCEEDVPASSDAIAIARLRKAGAAILGKTNMTEFAFSGVGINPHRGTPRNPADIDVHRIPGGSSSGAAVSVALGLAVAGLGSDTGGSIRIPAALCGLVGFKSTQARVPRGGAMELSRTLDTICAMTRSVQDCITVDGVIAGEALNIVKRPLKRLRLLVPQTLMLDSLAPEVARAFGRACTQLSENGVLVVEREIPELGEISQICMQASFSAIEAYAVHHLRLRDHRDQFDRRVALRMEAGAHVKANDYLAMLDRRQAWIRNMERQLEGFDAIMCPTVPIVAPEVSSLAASDDAFFRANGLLLRNPHVINFLDGCSFTLPCHEPGELPVGLMLSSTSGKDAELAALALAVEAALGPVGQLGTPKRAVQSSSR